MNRTTLLTALTAAALALPAASATAADYCVAPAGGCDADKTFTADGAGLQAALDAAKAAAGADRVLLGAATYTAPTADGFVYLAAAANPVELAGSGRDATTVTAPAGTSNVLSIGVGSTSVVRDLAVDMPASLPYAATGVSSSGDVRDVRVTASPQQNTTYTGIFITGGVLERTDVDLPSGLSTGVDVAGSAPVAVRDVQVTAYRGMKVRNVAGPTVDRARLHVLGEFGIGVEGTDAQARDVLVDHDGNGGSALYAEPRHQRHGSLVADGVTLVGGQYGWAVRASNAALSTHDAHVEIRNALVRGFQRTLDANQSGTGAVSIATAWSDYDDAPAKVLQSGTGTIAATDHSFVGDPGFVAADDFRLDAGSPLVDAGDPADPAAGRTDLAGNARSLAGSADCIARRDIGAYEHARRAPFAKATGTGAAATTPASFDAGASCDPDGDEMTYTWSFDDGATATGAQVTHSFAQPGTRTATVTVSDGTHSGIATVEVEIGAAPAKAESAGSSSTTPKPSSSTTTSTTSTASTAAPAGTAEPQPVTPATSTEPRPAAQSDAKAPAISKLRARRRGGKLRVRFTLDEAATVVVRVGRRRITLRGTEGANVLRLRARGKKVTLVATDAAGNAAKVARRVATRR